jgi:prepilin-type N-terminal cleavage/methylation domain-containing protein
MADTTKPPIRRNIHALQHMRDIARRGTCPAKGGSSNMQAQRNSSRGYSLIELLTVMAIIGVLSLITVPQFISFQRAGKMKSALRNFTMDIRTMRQKAITQNIWTRVVIAPAAADSAAARTYTFTQSSDLGKTWTPLPMRGGFGGNTTNVIGQGSGNVKELEKAVFFSAMTGYTNNGLVFKPNGVAGMINTTVPPVFTPVSGVVPPATPTNTIVLRTIWNVTNNQITISLTPSGQIHTTATHV